MNSEAGYHTVDNTTAIVYFIVKWNCETLPKKHDLHHSISIPMVLSSVSLPLVLCNAICSLIKYFTSQMYRHIAQNDLQCCIDYLLIQRCELFVCIVCRFERCIFPSALFDLLIWCLTLLPLSPLALQWQQTNFQITANYN